MAARQSPPLGLGLRGAGRGAARHAEAGVRIYHRWPARAPALVASPRLVVLGLPASGAASAHGWAGEVGRSEPEPSPGAPRHCLTRRPQSGRNAPAAGARMPPGAAGWQVPTRPDLGLATEGQIWEPTGHPQSEAAPTSPSPPLGAHASRGSPERRGSTLSVSPNPAWDWCLGEQWALTYETVQLLSRFVCRVLGYPLPRDLPRTGVDVGWRHLRSSWLGLGAGPLSLASYAVGGREEEVLWSTRGSQGCLWGAWARGKRKSPEIPVGISLD